ncbi:hypothetical protein D3C83_154100 [compost metagenome]
MLLIATLDLLFDRGLITFGDDGVIQISSRIPIDEYGSLGLSRSMRLRRTPNESIKFLGYHRLHVFDG